MWNAVLTHWVNNLQCPCTRVVAPATQMETKRPIWRKEWSADHLKRIKFLWVWEKKRVRQRRERKARKRKKGNDRVNQPDRKAKRMHLTWTKQYLFTAQTRVKRIIPAHHWTIQFINWSAWCVRLYSTHLTFVCEATKCRWIQFRQIAREEGKKKKTARERRKERDTIVEMIKENYRKTIKPPAQSLYFNDSAIWGPLQTAHKKWYLSSYLLQCTVGWPDLE